MTKKLSDKKSEKQAKPRAKPAATNTSEAPPPAIEQTIKPSRSPDPRLPAVGTVLAKKDRHGAVRCECTIEEAGIRYAGKIYRSLSSAAMAAAKDLGLRGSTQNGYSFFGLTKPPRPQRDPLAALERAWERYHGSAESIVNERVTDDNRSKVAATIRKHAHMIESLGEKIA
jgi:hypothetical protein